MDPIYVEYKSNNRKVFWTYSDNSRIYQTEEWVAREVSSNRATVIEVVTV